MRKFLAGASLLAVALSPQALANDHHPYPWDESVYENERFGTTVEQIADDVYVMRRIPSWRTMVQANVTVIVNDHDVVVVDAGTAAYVDSVVAEIKKITDKPVSTVVTTHWHGDHNRGNHVYEKHWPGVQFIAHERTYVNMLHWDKDLEGRYDDPSRRENFLKSANKSLEEKRAAGVDQKILTSTQDRIDGVDEIYATLKRSQSGIPDITFEDKLVLKRGDRTIELLYLGKANTDGDIVVWLPNEKIVATGDIVVRPTPYGFYSYPTEWAQTLDNIKALGFETLVPGHGRVMHDSAYIDTLAAMFRDLMVQSKAAIKGGASNAEELEAAIDFSKHEQAIAGDDPLFQYLFDIWFKTPIAVSAFLEATGATVSQFGNN